MDISKTTLGIDVWEGQLEIDEQTILDNGVEFIIIRVNDMNGGHHKDAGFDKQWAEAENFIRAPYFVYNPWVSGSQNYSYMRSILPPGVRVFMPDIEVKYTGYSPLIYAQQVEAFVKLSIDAGLKPVNYSGTWFMGYLSYWLSYVDYWWARYPTYLYPSTTTRLTWDALKTRLTNVAWYPNCGISGAPCRLWQCTADRYILPGTSRPIDVNVFNGTVQEMIEYYGFSDVQIPARLKAQPEPQPEPQPEQPLEQKLAALEKRVAALEKLHQNELYPYSVSIPYVSK